LITQAIFNFEPIFYLFLSRCEVIILSKFHITYQILSDIMYWNGIPNGIPDRN